FDFSDWVRKSQSDPDAGEGATSSPEKQSRSLEKPSVEPSSDVRSIQPSKNYRDELFGGGESNRTNPHATEVSERPNPWNPPQYRRRLPEPESTTIGRPRLKDRPAPAGSFT